MTDVVRVQLLGGFLASAGTSTVPASAWRLRKAKTLVKLLALEPSHRLHRDRIVDALWPDAEAADSRNNLHQVVHAARKALGTLGVDGGVLAWDGDLLAFGETCFVVTDVDELRGRVENARAAGDDPAAAQALGEIPGELLPEDEYESWAQPHVVAFREWRTRTVMAVADALVEAGDAVTVVGLLTPVVAVEPLNEPAHRVLMRALAAAGRRSEALVVYERLRAVLQDELAADPEPETRRLFRTLLTAPPADGVAIPQQRRGSDLPAPVTTLVGRDRELAEAAAILGRTRLLTLTGMGGAGKTTLAVELARRHASEFPGGAHLVELGTLTAGDQVASRIARTLHVEMSPECEPIDSLVAELRERRCLLVLDSCEHLVDTCAHLVTDLLRGCAELSVLATSREPLRIEGEVVWQTPSLELPDLERGTELEELRDIASVQLFVQRASAASPSFRLTDDNARAVAEICYRLDGIPLALELAAACIPMLAPHQIADRLGDALSLLRRGDRATITRQQTLAATLTWSHDLLSEDERIVYRRLAVFAGSFTYDAVEAVCASGVDAGRLLAAVARLVDTSLVVAETGRDVTRYRMLETVRQHATEKLRAAGEHGDVQQRHAGHYLDYAEARDPERPDAVTLVPVDLDVDQDNLRVAWTWGLQHDPQLSLKMSVALWRHWLARGSFADGRHRLEAVLAAAPEPSPLRARALFALAAFDIRRGSGERLEQLSTDAVAIHRADRRDGGLAQALHAAAALDYMRGDWDQSWLRAEESREAAVFAGDDQVAVAALHLQALVLMGRDDTAAALGALDDVRMRLRALPRSPRPFFPPLTLGFAVEGAGTPSPRVFFEETVLLGRQVAAEQAEGYVLCNLADVRRSSGDLDGALTLLDEAVCLFASLGSADGEALALNRLGCVHRVRLEFAAARDAFEQSLQLRTALGDRRGIGLTLANLGALFAAEGHLTRGLSRLNEALAGFEQTQDRPGRVGLATTIASVLADSGEYDEAAAQLLSHLPSWDSIPGNHRSTAWCYAMLADVERRRGRDDEAARAAATAHERLHALGVVHVLAHPAGLQRLR